MKRRDFLKLPALIPAVKKLLDDFTIPEETPVSDYIETSLNAKDKSDRQYGPTTTSYQNSTPIPSWYSFKFEEDDIEPGGFVYIKLDGYKSVGTGPFFELSNNRYCAIEHSPPDREGRWKAYVSSAPGIIFKEVFRYG